MTSRRANGTFLVRVPVPAQFGTYACHKKVYEACGRESRPLWRRTPDYLVALSALAPEDLDSRPYSPSPRAGQETRFDLLAEVSVSRKKGGQDRGRRCDPIFEGRLAQPTKSYAELAETHGRPWLDRQAARLGFEVLDLDRCDYEVIGFVRMKRAVRIGAVRFSGRLRVSNAEAFKAAMLDGVGHGKAWGCGLLLCFGK